MSSRTIAAFIWTAALLKCCPLVQGLAPQPLHMQQQNPVNLRAQTCSRFSTKLAYGQNRITIAAQDLELPASCDLGRSIELTTRHVSNNNWTEICSPMHGISQRMKVFQGPDEGSVKSVNFTVLMPYFKFNIVIVTLYSSCTSDLDAWLSVKNLFESTPAGNRFVKDAAKNTFLWISVPVYLILFWCLCLWKCSFRHYLHAQRVDDEVRDTPIQIIGVGEQSMPQISVATLPDPLSDKNAFLRM